MRTKIVFKTYILILTISLLAGFAPRSKDFEENNGIFEVTLYEGTNMAASLSPDGNKLAIDLVGRIWSLDSKGGRANPLTDPEGDARQPHWSPDGEWIAFQAYWNGDYDIWMIRPDGSDLQQVTSGPFDDREPHWSHDGGKIAFSSDRNGNYDIWQVTIETGIATAVTNSPANEFYPAYSPLSGYLAYVSDGDIPGIWIKETNGNSFLFSESDPGTSLHSPSWMEKENALSLSYTMQQHGSTELYIKALTSDVARLISREGEDVFPFRTSSFKSQLAYTSDGKIQTLNLSNNVQTQIPFRATVTLDRPAYRKTLRTLDKSGMQPVQGIISPAISPDGKHVSFTALGDVWTMPIGSPPTRLTNDAFVERDAVWSPSGQLLAYASDRTGSSQVWIHDLNNNETKQMTVDGGSFPSWSPDGKSIAYIAAERFDSSVKTLSILTGEIQTIRSELNDPGRATWSPDGKSIVLSSKWQYSTRFREGINKPLLIDIEGPIASLSSQTSGRFDVAGGPSPSGNHNFLPQRQPLNPNERWLDFISHGSVGSRNTDGPIWSPSGRMMAYVANSVLWVIPVGPEGNPVGPARRLTNQIADDPTWAGDSESILYLTSTGLERIWINDGRIEPIPLDLSWERKSPPNRYVIHAGSIFDGQSESLLKNRDIVIDGGRIVRISEHDDFFHTDTVIDASHGYIIPGLIETHTHEGLEGGEVSGRIWLSYGITSIRNPTGDPYEMMELRESMGSGRRIGPRIFGTGNSIDGSRIYYAGAPTLGSPSEIPLEMKRAELLEYDLIKTYVRLQDGVQKEVIKSAHSLGIPVSSHELYPAVANGADGVEHVRGTSRRGYSTKVSALNRSYQDVVSLLAISGMTLTPTIGIYGAYELVAVDDPSIFDDPRVTTFFPDAGNGHSISSTPSGADKARKLVEDMASLPRRVVENGGVVIMGTDTPINPRGLSLISEMQALVNYGKMRPLDVMRATTSAAAKAMGYETEIGSLRPGMIADLILLDENPLENIEAIRKVLWTIKGGELLTLEQLLR
jgi:Tol biopolymer transport system component/imidazolonepropionase-like amidohydrolase